MSVFFQVPTGNSSTSCGPHAAPLTVDGLATLAQPAATVTGGDASRRERMRPRTDDA
jgi:hypothetical protein